jgi:hypothetical protein
MIFDELTAVLARPAHPVDIPTSDRWGAVIGALGFALPVDYMQFIERYGSGCINDLIRVFNPFCAAEGTNLLHQLMRTLASLREFKEEYPADLPFPLLYEPGGLMPWGSTIDGDILCWRTPGAATGQWPVVVVWRSMECTEHAMPMSRFLARALQGTLEDSRFPEDFAVQAPIFAPAMSS